MFDKKITIRKQEDLHQHFQKHLEENRNIECGVFRIFMGRIEMMCPDMVLKGMTFCPFCGVKLMLVQDEGKQ